MISQLRNEIVSRVVPALPRRLRERLVPQQYSWGYADLRVVARPKDPSSSVRLLIAPANYASQAYYWARAAEKLPGVSAQNLAFGYSSSGHVAAPDTVIEPNVGRHSRIWARKQRDEILRGFTHVLYEAERPILGGLYDHDVIMEIRDLQHHGIQVAMLSHGSDVRTPSRHIELEPYSPFVEPLDGLTAGLVARCARNHEVLNAFEVPKFVSTPDLLNYVPDATWLPTLTDEARWESLPTVQLGVRPPVVLHVPSRSALKGTRTISAAMRPLEAAGLIEYVEAERVPYAEMPAMVSRADVVIDQLTMGLYGVASVEAMLAGRLVVAQAGSHIRNYVEHATGWPLPIVEANPDTIYDVIRNIAEHPDEYKSRIIQGREFASEVHSASRVAAALENFLRVE